MTDALCETTKTEKEYESVYEEDFLIYTHSLSLSFSLNSISEKMKNC